MPFKHCSRCRILFDSQKDNLCLVCKENEEKTIKKITDFIQSIESSVMHSCNVNTISKATGVPVQEIQRLYRANKLRGITNSIELNCIICGKKFKPTIFSGVCCKKCSKKVEEAIQELKNTDTKNNDNHVNKEITECNIQESKQTSGMHMNAESKSRCGFKKDN